MIETLSITHGQRTPAEQAELETRLAALRAAFTPFVTPEAHALVEKALAVLSVGTPVELLQALVTKPVATLPVEAPGAIYLRMSVSEFIAQRVSLEVYVRESRQTLWLGDAAIPDHKRSSEDPARPAFGTGVWTGEQMLAWLTDSGGPPWTIRRLVELLGGEVRSVRRATP